MSVREMLRQATGLDLSQQSVDRALSERSAKSGAAGAAGAAHYSDTMAPAELAALIELVVVPESWMFRDADAFAAATACVRRRLAGHPDRVVRILSLPCAGGEEPYSMAMALADAGVAPAAFRIDGVDLSTVALERAAAGRYTRNAFRGNDLAFRERHFRRDGDEYQISDAIRAQVSFAHGNLLAFDCVAGAGRYDVVFCRNLLIYFDEATTAAAIGVLRALLADDGTLFAGYAEVPSFCRYGFTPLRLQGAFALQKTQAPRAEQPTPPRQRAARPPAPATTAAREKRPPQPAAVSAAIATDLLAQARRLADQGDYPAAAAACDAQLASEPDSADAYFILGMVSEGAHRPGAAADYWRRCVYLQPDHYEALCHLALLAEQAGDTPQAALLRRRAARIHARQDDSEGAR